jgi:hypothetical protein
MNTLADSTISWKSNLATMATPEQALTLRANLDASYEAGYRDGSINYELEHCPACKNFADLQVALDENAKLRELAVGMYGMFEMFDKMLGNHDACETPRPLIFGEDKSFKDVMRELGIEVDE